MTTKRGILISVILLPVAWGIASWTAFRTHVVIRSDGKYTRDYIYIEDIIDAYILLAERLKVLDFGGEAFNFSNEDPISVLKLCEKINDITGNHGIAPKILNQAEYEITYQYLSVKKARELLHWRAKYSLDERLKKTMGTMALEEQAPGKEIFNKLLEKRTDEILSDPRERLWLKDNEG